MLKRTIGLMLTVVVTSGCFWKGNSIDSVPGAGSESIASGSFDVAARNFKPFKVIVPQGATNAVLEGTFTASGGSGDDIEVTLLDEVQFLNWQNRHKFQPLYESGRITADRMKVTLPPDASTYVVVFSNRFSLLSAKGVVADLKLRYDPLEK